MQYYNPPDYSLYNLINLLSILYFSISLPLITKLISTISLLLGYIDLGVNIFFLIILIFEF